jgi:hypothetical protein
MKPKMKPARARAARRTPPPSARGKKSHPGSPPKRVARKAPTQNEAALRLELITRASNIGVWEVVLVDASLEHPDSK